LKLVGVCAVLELFFMVQYIAVRLVRQVKQTVASLKKKEEKEKIQREISTRFPSY